MSPHRVRFPAGSRIVAVSFMAVLVGFGFSLVSHAITSVQIAFAEDQTAIFEEMRKKTAESATVDVGPLEYTLRFYPSGTKLDKGSTLDRIVERARQSTIREIIAMLRSRTGLDLGDDPQRWVERLKAPASQVQRTLKFCSRKDFQQEGFVPAAATAFHGETVTTGMLFQQ